MTSSYSKGDAFEGRVFEALESELREDRLCAIPRSAKIFRKKGYESRDRGSAVIVDISIELFISGGTSPAIVWVSECKDYRGAIPVNDVEEFHSKLQHIGEDRTKGTLVTSGALQRSALAYAKAKGIGVIRLLPDDQIEIILHLMAAGSHDTDLSEFGVALTDPAHRSERGFFASADGYWFGNWFSFLSHGLSLE